MNLPGHLLHGDGKLVSHAVVASFDRSLLQCSCRAGSFASFSILRIALDLPLTDLNIHCAAGLHTLFYRLLKGVDIASAPSPLWLGDR